jgi:2-dehydro-3-deoxyphosphogluconate aldolase/(4S)-4-hydroxy-2-oxoglutarate aldolase
MTVGAPALPFELRASGVIAILQAGRPEFWPVLAGYLWDAGIGTVEVPVGAIDVELAVSALSETPTVVGVREVVTVRQAEAVIAAGACLVSTPGGSRAVVRRCVELGVPAIPVLRSRRELRAGLPNGAAAIRIAAAPSSVREAARRFPGVAVIASGDIDARSAVECIDAGAHAVATEGWLLGDAVEGGSLDALAGRARQLVAAVAARLVGSVGV